MVIETLVVPSAEDEEEGVEVDVLVCPELVSVLEVVETGELEEVLEEVLEVGVVYGVDDEVVWAELSDELEGSEEEEVVGVVVGAELEEVAVMV